MSVDAAGGGASVGSSDRSGGNNVGHEWSIRMDQSIEESSGKRFNEEEKKNEESGDQRISEEEKKNEESGDQRISEEEKKNEESCDQRFSEREKREFDYFDEALEAVNKKGRDAGANPKIQKVPSMLRNNNKFSKYFLPKVFSFGPYSVDQDLSTDEMAEQIKFNLVAKFLQQNGVEKEDLYKEIKNRIQELRNCYNDLPYFYEDRDDALAWMFLVDGCAILQFMYISVNFWENEDSQFRILGINTDYEVFLEQDLFLLENQLPYRLLRLIIQHASKHQKTTEDDTSKEDKLLQSIYEFIFNCFKTREEWYENGDKILEDLKDDHVHLLDLLRKILIHPLHQKAEKRDLLENIIQWIVDLFDKLKCTRNESDRDRFAVQHRNIKKLREAGINLKPSKTSCVGDISFSGGTLKMPHIILEESTAKLFLNMIGYELCPDFQNRSEISTYIYFLDKLIDRTQDVEELREKNILRNELSSDEEVVNLFNEIGTHLRPNIKYYIVKRNIDNYFENKGLIWLHKICHDIHHYFKRRWSLLAFIGVLLAVVSSIFQSVITFLAYQTDSKKGI